MGKIITIPKNLARKGELVMIPRKEYEEYLRFKKIIPLVKPNSWGEKAIKEGRKEIKEGKYLTLKQFKNELGD